MIFRKEIEDKEGKDFGAGFVFIRSECVESSMG